MLEAQTSSRIKAAFALFVFFATALALRLENGALIDPMHGFTVAVPEHMPKPEIEMASFNHAAGNRLDINYANFELREYCTDLGEDVLQGHVHVFIDGKRYSSLYGPTVWLDDLEPGEHRIQAYLASSIDHRYFIAGGELIMAEQTVTIH